MIGPLFVPGAPAPQGSKRHIGNGRMVEMSKTLGPWRERVALAAHNHGFELIEDGPVLVRLEFVMPRPKSAPKTRTPAATKRPDVDKLARAILDALTGIAWRDDSQVIELLATKAIALPGEPSGVQIVIRRPEED